MLDVTASAGVPPFTTARFSVAGLPAIPAHEVAYDGKSHAEVRLLLARAQRRRARDRTGLSASCVVGVGTAQRHRPARPHLRRGAAGDRAGDQHRSRLRDVSGRVGRRAGRCRRRRATRRSARRIARHRRAHRRANDTSRLRPARVSRRDQVMHQLEHVLLRAQLRHDLARAGLLRQLRGEVHAARRRGLLRSARVYQRRLLLARDVLVYRDIVLRGAGLWQHQPRPRLLRQRGRAVHPPRRRRLLRGAPLREQRLQQMRVRCPLLHARG